MLAQEAVLAMGPSPQPRFLCLNKILQVRDETAASLPLLMIVSTNYLVDTSKVVVSCGHGFFFSTNVAAEGPAQVGHR